MRYGQRMVLLKQKQEIVPFPPGHHACAALSEDDPVLAPMGNRERAERGAYNRQDPDAVLRALDSNVDRFVELAGAVTADQCPTKGFTTSTTSRR